MNTDNNSPLFQRGRQEFTILNFFREPMDDHVDRKEKNPGHRDHAMDPGPTKSPGGFHGDLQKVTRKKHGHGQGHHEQSGFSTLFGFSFPMGEDVRAKHVSQNQNPNGRSDDMQVLKQWLPGMVDYGKFVQRTTKIAKIPINQTRAGHQTITEVYPGKFKAVHEPSFRESTECKAKIRRTARLPARAVRVAPLIPCTSRFILTLSGDFLPKN